MPTHSQQRKPLFKFIVSASLLLLTSHAQASPASVKAAAIGCSEEIGTEVPSVGKYILATRSANATISPGQCLFSSNMKFFAWNQPVPQGNFVVYPSDNVSETSSKWSHETVGQPTVVIVQNDGHFVAYPTSQVIEKNGSYHGKRGTGINPIPTNASSLDSYFLIMQDNGVLGLFRGPNPSQNTGMIWQSDASPAQLDYCLILLSSNGAALDRVDTRSSSPVLAFGKGTPEVEAWNRSFPGNAKKAVNFSMALGKCQ